MSENRIYLPKTLIFHPIIAPYRIDFFNALSIYLNAKIYLTWRNFKGLNKFDYSKIEKQLNFNPTYIVREELGWRKWLKSIWTTISNSNPNLVITSEFGLVTCLALLHRWITRKHYRIVSIVDDSFDMLYGPNHFTLRHQLAMKCLMPFLDNVINVEPQAAEWYKSHFGKGLYFPIICDDKIAVKRQERAIDISQRYLNEYNLVGKRVLLYVGRLVKQKNIEASIRAFVKADVEDSVFIIVGDGKERERLKSIASGHSNILFVGRYEGDDLYAWYNVGHVLTLPSFQEAFGAVTNEALVAGCKVLVSKHAGSNCLVADNNGKIIDPNDIDSFAEDIKCIFRDIKPLISPLAVKPNLMQSSFEENFSRLVTELKL